MGSAVTATAGLGTSTSSLTSSWRRTGGRRRSCGRPSTRRGRGVRIKRRRRGRRCSARLRRRSASGGRPARLVSSRATTPGLTKWTPRPRKRRRRRGRDPPTPTFSSATSRKSPSPPPLPPRPPKKSSPRPRGPGERSRGGAKKTRRRPVASRRAAKTRRRRGTTTCGRWCGRTSCGGRSSRGPGPERRRSGRRRRASVSTRRRRETPWAPGVREARAGRRGLLVRRVSSWTWRTGGSARCWTGTSASGWTRRRRPSRAATGCGPCSRSSGGAGETDPTKGSGTPLVAEVEVERPRKARAPAAVMKAARLETSLHSCPRSKRGPSRQLQRRAK
mmetsp:Transcript_68564/g.155057  ORF Transcript_68564/g.155057 Transcript_68564/m.155057 type:complete len:333 (-) Transcript_68564:140-1138(-)